MSRREDQTMAENAPASSSSSFRSAEPVSPAESNAHRQRSFSRAAMMKGESPRMVSLQRSGSADPEQLVQRDANAYVDGRELSPVHARSPGSYSAMHSPTSIRRGLPSSSASAYRRPSSSASHSQARRLSNDSSLVGSFTSAAASPTSQPSTPKTKSTSSRSRILASSAAALEGSPPWQQQRLSEGVVGRSLSPLPIQQTQRMRNMSGSTIGSPSLVDRKRRLASATGSQAGSIYDDGMNDAASISGLSIRTNAEPMQTFSDQASIHSVQSSSNQARRRGQSSADEYQRSEKPLIQARTHSASNIDVQQDSEGQSSRTDATASPPYVTASIKDRFFTLRKDKRVKDDDSFSAISAAEQAPTAFHRNLAKKSSAQTNSINPQTYLDELESPRTPRKDLPASRYDLSTKLSATTSDYKLPQSPSATVVQAGSNPQNRLHGHNHLQSGSSTPAEQDDVVSEHYMPRLGSAFTLDTPVEATQRGHSKSNASISSMASHTSHVSNSSYPARTSSLKQIGVPSINAVPAPAIGSPAGSSYKSVPHSPIVASSFSHEEGYHRTGSSLAHSNSHRASWRQSTLSTAAGQSGAGALAAIRARFGEPAGNEDSPGVNSTENAFEASLTQADNSQSKVSEESVEMMAETDGSAELSRTLNETSRSTSEHRASDMPSPHKSAKMEPLRRPVKSPLRGRNSSGAEANPSMTIPNKDTNPQPMALTNGKALSPMSPPRKSLEELGVGSALLASESQSSFGSGIQMTPSPSESLSQRQSGKRSFSSQKLERSDVLTHGDESQLSLATDDGTQVGHESLMSRSDSKSKRYNTLRRMTPPTLFGTKTSSKAHAQQDSVSSMEGRQRVSSADTSLVPSGQRKKSLWRLGLGKNDSQDGTSEDSKATSPLPTIPTLPSTSSSPKLGMLSIRSRKSDPQVDRAPIKRFFDSSNANKEARNGKGKVAGLKDSPSITSIDRKYEEPTLSTHGGALGSEARAAEKVSLKAKADTKRWNAIRELIETERTYATDLGIVRDVYLIRAKTMAGLPAASPLHTPLTSYGTPILPSPSIGTPLSITSTHSSVSTKRGTASPLTTTQSIRQQLLPDSTTSGNIHGASSGASLPSAASSGIPSNRSSTYTTSSHTSSEYSFNWPPNGSSLPGTPSVGATSSNHKNASLHAASPVPSVQQSKPTNGNLSKLQTASVLSAPLPVSSDAPLSASDMRVIFAHVESCLALALEMSSVFQVAAGIGDRDEMDSEKMMNKGDDAIGQAFLMLMPRIEVVYTAYCSRHEASMQRLQEVLAASPKAVTFFRDCTEIARKMTTAWDLGSLLIKPVQRVLKYPLLLRQILSATDAKHRDHANLVEALHNMQNVADKINQVKRRRDLADYLITGRDRDGRPVGQAPLNASQSVRGKKKGGGLTPRTSNTGVGDDSLISDEALEVAAEEYGEILKKFEALQSRVAIFGRQCGGWSHSLRECYYVQLRIIGSLRHIYALRSYDNEAGMPRPQAPSCPEEVVLAAYMDVLKSIINRSWRQMDSEIRSAILPMTFKIESMFDAPRSVIVKRDEREADYVRSRQMLAQGGVNAKMIDRRMIESANGFVALQSQLIDELPAFVQGVQVLLDVGVQAFARLQAAHFDEVKNLTLEFWSDKAGHAEEVDMVGLDDEDMLNVGPTLRNINPIRAFWESHQPFSQWGESLLISRRDSELQAFADESETAKGSNAGTDDDRQTKGTANGNITPTISVAHDELGIFRSPFAGREDLKSGDDDGETRMPRQNGLGLVHSGSNNDSIVGNGLPRRPSNSGVASLIRSISGTFSRDTTPSPSVETAPPLPDKASSMIRQHIDAAESQRSISADPPSLPSLVFKDDGSDGFFIQNSPVSFLDAVLKEPYDKSPMLMAADLKEIRRNGVVEADLTALASMSSNGEGDDSTRESSFSSLVDSSQHGDQVTVRNGGADDGKTSSSLTRPTHQPSNSLGVSNVSIDGHQRHKIKALFQCIALHDSQLPPSPSAHGHLGWPFVRYACGDTFRVLSMDDSGADPLYFGRLDKSGEMGWVQQAHFSGGSGRKL